jgi:hypothetical protein
MNGIDIDKTRRGAEVGHDATLPRSTVLLSSAAGGDLGWKRQRD